MKIALFGSSLVSSCWNEATPHSGPLKALPGLGHDITFYEPGGFGRPRHRDVCGSPSEKVAIYPGASEGCQRALDDAATCLVVDAREGIAQFLEPDSEAPVAADGEEVAERVTNFTPDDARQIAAAARSRILAHHTYESRARAVNALLERMTQKDAAA
jgi:spore maturation protein CgeB